ncbi:MAG: hypothetical protein QXE98_05630 [Archaeoglobaceae archaeon]
MPETKAQPKPSTKKFLSGYVDFGILGRREACLFRNESRDSEKQPGWLLFVKEGESWKEVEAFWVKVKEKEAEEL